MKLTHNITVLGCGHGGMALAADLKAQGAQVALWSDENHATKFDKIVANQNEILLNIDGNKNKFKPDLITKDLRLALQFGDILYNCTPMQVHRSLFAKITAEVNQFTNKKILVNFSGVFSALDQYLHTSDKTKFDKLKLFDTATFPYACRAGDANDVTISGRKTEIKIAPLFLSDYSLVEHIPEYCRPTSFNLVENSFKLGLMGINAVFHAATVLFNARLIDSGTPFHFYRDGTTKQTSLLHEALDNERILLAKTMGYALESGIEADNYHYGTNFVDIHDACSNSEIHQNIKSPPTLNHRFVTEDIPYGLVPLLGLAKLYDTKLPNIKSIVKIFSTIMNED